MVEIDKETFFKIIYFFKLDVHPYYPVCRKAHWKTRNQNTFGEMTAEGENWPYVERWYVTKYWANRSTEIPKDFTC